MSIATQITALQTDKTNISNSITTMGGTVNSGDGFDNFAADILTIPQGGGGPVIPPKDVNFYDYDGTVLYAYTLAEAQALQALPALPEGPTGYTASSWTETLNTINNIPGPINVGVNYTTSKYGTEFDIVIGDEKDIYGFCPAGGGTIDWGDGTMGWQWYGLVKHTYAQSGEYTVTISNTTSSFSLIGYTVDPYTETVTSTAAPPLMFCSEAYAGTLVNSSLVKRIRIGSHIPNTIKLSYNSLESVLIACQMTSIPNNSFSSSLFKHISLPSSVTSLGSSMVESCSMLQSIVIPTSVTSVGQGCFSGCRNLKIAPIYNVTSVGQNAFQNCSQLVYVPMSSITSFGTYCFSSCFKLKPTTLSSSLTTIPVSMFSSCYSIQTITIPSSVTSINSSSFYYCKGLQTITIPSSVTSIDMQAFYNCDFLSEVIMKRTTPPTLSTYVFNNTYSTMKIYVPYSEDHSILNAYKTASGWRNYASKIVESDPE